MIIILEGESGTGKTTVLAAIAQRAKADGRPVRGVLCPGRFEAGVKQDISAADLETGDTWLFAYARPVRRHALPFMPREPRFDDSAKAVVAYGRWAFVRSALARANDAICRPRPEGRKRQLVVIDEIGPLELAYGTGLMEALALVDRAAGLERAPENATMAERELGVDFIVAARPDIATRLGARWQGSRRVVMGGMAGSGAELAASEVERLLSLRR